MPTGIRFNRMMTENELIRLGCTFETSNPSHISSLLNILKKANIKVAIHADDSQEFEPREGIYLTTDYDSEIKFLFGRAYTDGDHVNGSFTQLPLIKEQFITGKQSLPKELFDWALAIGNPESQAGEEHQVECELFMSKSGFYRNLP